VLTEAATLAYDFMLHTFAIRVGSDGLLLAATRYNKKANSKKKGES
jgi:hypothetical protein